MIRDLQDGIHYIAEGCQLAKQKKLRPYLIIPLVANIVLFSLCGYLVFDYARDWIQNWESSIQLWSWLDWLESALNQLLETLKWLIFSMVILLLLFVMSSTFTMITHLLIGPFIGILGEKAESHLRPVQFPENTLMQVVRHSLARECQKLWYWLIRAAGLAIGSLILSFIPVINTAIPVLWFLFGSWLMAMQYIDVAADNNGYRFEQVLAFMKQNRMAVMSFGAVIMALTAIPIINLFIIPVAVCSGVVFWVRRSELETH